MTQAVSGDPSATERSWTNQTLGAFIGASLVGDGGGFSAHIDLDLGVLFRSDQEATLYSLLGVSEQCQLLVGISEETSGDVAYCRTQWGSPAYRVDINSDASSLKWLVWAVTAAALLRNTEVAGSLVIPAQQPLWIFYARPDGANAMLFPTITRCVNHTLPDAQEPELTAC